MPPPVGLSSAELCSRPPVEADPSPRLLLSPSFRFDRRRPNRIGRSRRRRVPPPSPSVYPSPMLPEEEKDPMHAAVDFRLDGQKQPTLFGQSDRNSPQSDPADEPQPPTLDPTVIAAPLGNPPEDPFASSGRPLRTLLRRLLRNPFRRPSRRSLRKPLRQPPRSTPPFGSLRSTPRVPNPFGAVAKPYRVPLRSLRRNLLRSLSEKATCPECRRRHPLRKSPSAP